MPQTIYRWRLTRYSSDIKKGKKKTLKMLGDLEEENAVVEEEKAQLYLDEEEED